MTIAEIITKFDAHKNGKEWIATCPAHADSSPSLAINEGNNGGVVMLCRAGCPTEKVLAAKGLKMSDLFTEKTNAIRTTPPEKHNGKLHPDVSSAANAARWYTSQKTGVEHREVRRWPYHNTKGDIVAYVIRFNPISAVPDENGKIKKAFVPIHRDGAGWRVGDPPGLWPLYNLTEILKSSETVFITEGEKASEAGKCIGLICSTSAHGSQSPDKTDWTPLTGHNVVILPDNDKSGIKYTKLVEEHLVGIAKSIRIVELPGLPIKGDLYDFVEARDAQEIETIRAEIDALVAQAEPLTQVEAGELPAPLNASIWALEVLPEPDQILNGAFDMGTKNIVVAPSKARKSFVLLQFTVSLAGKLPKFLAWDLPKPRRVLFWNLEITPTHFHKRLLRMLRALDLTPADLGDRLLILNTRGMDATESGLSQLDEIVKKLAVDVVVVDPIYKLISGDESKQEEIKYLLRGLDRLCTETGCAVVYSHHCGKGMAGDKQAIDRASGSGVLARDFDCQIGLTPHVEDGMMVVEQIARSYPPRDAFTIGWDDTRGCFEVMDGVAPVIQNSHNRNTSGRVGPGLTDEDALAIVSEKPLSSAFFDAELSRIGFTRTRAKDAKARLFNAGKLAEFQPRTFPRRIFLGTPESIEKMEHDYQNPKFRQISGETAKH